MGDISGFGARGLTVADYVAFDLETTGLSPETDEILEVALVRFSGGQPAERWSSLVKSKKPVPLKTVRLTHINPEELADSPSLADLLDKVSEFRASLPLVGHNSGFDASFLQKHIQGFPGVPLYDTLELARIAVPGFKSYKLVDLARELGVSVSEAHRAYDDAEVSGAIFRLLQIAIGRMSHRNRKAVRDLMGDGWSARHMFEPKPVIPSVPAQLSLFDEPGAPAQSEHLEQPAVAIPPAPHALPFIDALKEPLLAALDESRPVQAVNVPATIEVASSVARLAADYAQSCGKRVLLLGFPSDCLPGIAVRAGTPEDYACVARLEEAVRQAGEGSYTSCDAEQRKFLAGLFRWAEATSEGNFAEIQWGIAGRDVVPEVSCPPEMQCKDLCPHSGRCFYLAAEARIRAGRAGVPAHTSHSAGVRMRLPLDVAFVWGSSDLGRSWQGEEARLDLTVLREAVNRAGISGEVPSLADLVSAAGSDLSRGGTASNETSALAARVSVELGGASLALRGQREGGAPAGFAVDPPLLWKDLHAIEAACKSLDGFASGGREAVETTRLVEQSYGDDSRKGAVLAKRAVWPARAAIRALLGSAGRVLLFSDVLQAASRSDGGRRMMGLDDAPGTVVDLTYAAIAEPARPEDVLFASLDAGKMVSPPEYAAYLAGFIERLALRVRKGLLVAFPSRTLLRETYALVQPALEEQGIAVYGHGLDGGHRVVDHLLDEDSVVLGMAGSGPVAGDPVPTCIVLARVPFAPPNPLDEVRRAQVSSTGGSSFVEVNVRPPALALRSHVEKMLQAGSRRAVVLADPKVLPRRSNWGPEFTSAFADLPKVSCPERELLQRVDAHLRG